MTVVSSTVELPNSLPAIQKRLAAGRIDPLHPVAMLFARIMLFAAFQALIAAIYALLGDVDAWASSAAWWIGSAFLSNMVCLLLLSFLAKREGLRLKDLYNFDRSRVKRDLLLILGLLVIAGPVSMLPNTLLSGLLFGEPNAANILLIRPLPLWGLIPLLVLFPLTMALAEAPTYFGYIMPRLEAVTHSKVLAVLIPSFMLGAQHMTMPLLFDARFMLWRLLMFMPFALLLGVALRWRPSLLPYLMVVHGLMDLATAILILFPPF